jgi:hypothetical protein
MSQWGRVETEVGAVIRSRPGQYGTRVRASLDALVSFLKATNRPAPSITAGYWATFSLTWSSEEARNLEIEVFEDRYEIYRFFDGRTEIWEEPRMPERDFSSKFIAELPNAAPPTSQSSD